MLLKSYKLFTLNLNFAVTANKSNAATMLAR